MKKFSYLAGSQPPVVGGAGDGSVTNVKLPPAMSRKQQQWEDTLNANKVGAQMNAEDFTREFMQDMYASTEETSATSAEVNVMQQHETTSRQDTRQVIKGV